MFQIDYSKKFSYLARAPIVEAVLHWQATMPKEMGREELESQLRKSFSDYEISPQHNLEMAFMKSSDGVEMKQSSDWEGFRLVKNENGQLAFVCQSFVCQFKRDGPIFSRLAPYQGWAKFEQEAMRFWQKFVEIGKPPEIARLSTRYISQMPINSASKVEDLIDHVPEPLASIGILAEDFHHQDTAKLAGLPYTVTLVRAVQSTQQSAPSGKSLIVDIGVSTTESITDFDTLPQRLLDLRFIKNELFFTIMKNAEDNFGDNNQ